MWRRRLAFTIAIAFLITVVTPIALFYGFDFRLERLGDSACFTLASDRGETHLWESLAWAVAPVAGGVLAYAAVILFAPGRLGRTWWRFLFAVPIAALVTFAVGAAAFSGLMLYRETCPT